MFRLKTRWIYIFVIASLLLLPACAPQDNATPQQYAPDTLISPVAQTASQAIAPDPTPTKTRTGFPDPNNYEWRLFAGGLSTPIAMGNPADGTGRLFILEKAGVIKIILHGSLLPEPFLDISDRVGSAGSEQGLLGIAFHPNYASIGFFYVDYTGQDGNIVISRFHVSANPDQADRASEKVILRIEHPFRNHNGGQLAFGPDGYLYIGVGDGGSEGDPRLYGQNMNVLLAKILRIDVDHGDPYSIPPDNPFVKGGGRPEAWLTGLRNPWRFSFDSQTGDLFIGDVGQDNWEEVDFLPAGSKGGENYGWSFREGFHPYKGNPPANLKLVDPVTEYGHDQGCAIIGGYIYRGKTLPEWDGIYFFGDYCSGNVWGLLHKPDGSWQSRLLFNTSVQISSFGQDQDGEIYLLSYNGQVFQLLAK
jgi:glucose/arabinose dehydrogenase